MCLYYILFPHYPCALIVTSYTSLRSPTFNSRPGQIEERLHNLERLIHSVTSQLPSSPDTQNLSVISSTGEDLLLDRLPHIAGQEKQGANRYQSPSPSAPQDAGDTVDGMGAVIFADEIGSGFFGKHIFPIACSFEDYH